MNGRATQTSLQPGLRSLALLGVIIGITALSLATATQARAANPWWHITSEMAPANLTPGKEATLVVRVSNLGSATADGHADPVVLGNTISAGAAATAISGLTKNGVPTSCSLATLQCRFEGHLYPYEELAMSITLRSTAPAEAKSGVTDQATASGGGGGATGATLEIPTTDGPAAFGIERFEQQAFGEDGATLTAAGSHPFELTTTLALNQSSEPREPVSLPKDFAFTLPPGLIGNPNATTQCTMADFFSLVNEANLCPVSAVVGVATLTADEPLFAHVFTKTVPVFNLVPSKGEPARFGFEVIGKVPIVLDTSVRTGRDYGVNVTVKNATQTAGVLSSQVTIWGEPGAASHNNARGWECVAGGFFANQVGKSCPESNKGLADSPFLTMPTSCASTPSVEPVVSSAAADSWSVPGALVEDSYEWLSRFGEPLGFTDCAKLPFAPSISVTSEVSRASNPTAMTVGVHVAQNGLLEAGELASAHVRNATVALPAGVELSPSAANGLVGCSEAEAGFEGIDPATGMQLFSPQEAACPPGSKLGVAHIKTPLLANELEGALYLADPAPRGEPGRNPFASLVAVYLVARDPVSGVLVKLAGRGELNEATGQLSTTFSDTPQVPFEELKLDLFGGPRASLSTPASCGSYPPVGVFTPWSGTGPVTAASEGFTVDHGAGGTECPAGAPPFAPEFSAQSGNTQAGGFTPFTVDIGRPDGDQSLTGVSVHLPPGIAAVLSSVTPCAEPPAGAEWSCGLDSLVGHSMAWSGLGSEPVTLPGDVYLTSGYDGAPFGLLVRTHAAAGPFDLGYVNVRARIDVNPTDASVTIATDPGPHGDPLPVRLKGIPAQLKSLQITVDRPDFEFNPTSCNPTSVTGNLFGDQGAVAPVSSRFQVAGCDNLPFAPKLSASVDGKGSRVDGTTFKVRLESAGLGQGNIRKVLLQLPKLLPSRLETLKKACLAATFEANPASCSPESVIGTATIHTPVLKSQLTGPAYLVSHGNAAFPDVEFVLQGEGILLIVDGQTDIKNGVTYSKVETAPDAPFTSFETVLPAGPKSVLAVYDAANSDEPYSACGARLTMPTTIISQANKVIETETPITTMGCSGVKSSKSTRLSLRQRYIKALHACRTRYKRNKARRQSCERKVHTSYAAKARAACRHKSRHARRSCEVTARHIYAMRRGK